MHCPRFTSLSIVILLLSAGAIPAFGQEVLIRDLSVDLIDKSTINLTIPRKKLEEAPKVLGEGKQESASVNASLILDSVLAWLKANPKHDVQDVSGYSFYPVNRSFQAPTRVRDGNDPFGTPPDGRFQLDRYQWKFDHIIGREIDLGVTPGALSYSSRPSGRMYFEVIFHGLESKGGSQGRLSVFAFQDGSILIPSVVKATEAQLHKADRERRGL